jgi:hypothetical protein
MTVTVTKTPPVTHNKLAPLWITLGSIGGIAVLGTAIFGIIKITNRSRSRLDAKNFKKQEETKENEQN